MEYNTRIYLWLVSHFENYGVKILPASDQLHDLQPYCTELFVERIVRGCVCQVPLLDTCDTYDLALDPTYWPTKVSFPKEQSLQEAFLLHL